jgi:SAM-dependent methyltransferase
MTFYTDFAEYYERIFPFRETVYEFLRRHARRSGRVLDVGCGTGHYCGRFATEGYSVLGIDVDDAMIDAARARYAAAEFRVLDMRSLDTLEGPFELVFCIGNVASHVDRTQFAAMIRNVNRLLSENGTWILQTVNWDYILKHGTYVFPPRQFGPDLPSFYREYRDVSNDGLRFVTRLEDGGKVLFSDEVRLYPVRAEAYVSLHAEYGFELVSHEADFQGTLFVETENSGSVFVFQKSV